MISSSSKPFGHVEWARGITDSKVADLSVSLGKGLSYSPEAGVLIPVGDTGVQVNLDMDLYVGSTGVESIERHNQREDVKISIDGNREFIRNRPFFRGTDIVRGPKDSKVIDVPRRPYKGKETDIVREGEVVYIDPPGSGIWNRTSLTRDGDTIKIRPHGQNRDIVVELGEEKSTVSVPGAYGPRTTVITNSGGEQVIDYPSDREEFVVTRDGVRTYMKRPGWRNFTTFHHSDDSLKVDQPSYSNDTLIRYR